MVLYGYRNSLVPLVATGLLLFSGAAFLLFSANGPHSAAENETESGTQESLPEEPLSEVEAVILTPTPFPRCVEAFGRVRAARDVRIATRIGGTVKDVQVRNGDVVRGQEVLATLESTEYRLEYDRASSLLLGAQIEYRSLAGAMAVERLDPADSTERIRREEDSMKAATLAYESGRLTYDEYKRLVRDHECSIAYIRAHRSDVIAYKSGLVQAKDALERARLNLEATTIRAPFRGMVADCVLVPGMSLSAGTFVCRVVDRTRVIAEVDVLESDVQEMGVGDSCRVDFPLFREAGYRGIIRDVNPVIAPESRTMHAAIEVLPPSANPLSFLESHPPGSSVHAIIEVDRVDSCLVVPSEAVLMRDGRQVVFVASANRAVWRYVRVGREENGLIELLEGVGGGDTVVVSGHTVLAHEAKVRIRQVARDIGGYRSGKGG